MLQIFIIFYGPGLVFGLPSIGRFNAVIVAFAINYACYFSEIYRAGIESISKGQYEAGQVLGMTKTQVFFRVVLFQVIKRIVPPMSNEIITLVKDTALARVISVIDIIKEVCGRIPVFGISLGMQLIALAYGAKVYKMKCGHHGGSAVRCLESGRVDLTAQNHGFALDAESLKATALTITHENVLDGSVEGIECKADKVFAVQFHPESAPGPQDSTYLFDKFIKLMEEYQNA